MKKQNEGLINTVKEEQGKYAPELSLKQMRSIQSKWDTANNINTTFDDIQEGVKRIRNRNT